ncbi:MAG: ribonuclease P protein component [Geminicoccaceae bacterium]
MDAESSPAGGPRDASVCPPDDQRDPSDFRGYAIADREPAVRHEVVRLKRRSEFLAVAGTGRRWVAPAFVLQAGRRTSTRQGPDGEIGIGFTATKRIGNAVARNRAKRRLREAARLVLPDAATAGHDYVVVARATVLTCAFQTLLADLEKAFSRVLTTKPKARPKSPAGRPSRDPPPSAS